MKFFDQENGIKSEYEYDSLQDKFLIKKTQDVEPILKFNKMLQNNESLTRGKDLRRVAKIPMVVIDQWLKDGIDIFSQDPEMKRKVKQRLNDPNYRFLRTDLSRL
jgi:hypothetical protein